MGKCNVNLKAVGDITLVTKCNSSPFEKIKNLLTNKDILLGNLETVLSTKGIKAEKAIILHNNPEKVKYLKDAGFDILNLANNHITDLGIAGFNETLDVLNKSNMRFFGVSNSKFPEKHAIMEKQGSRLGFLGYSESGYKNIQNGIVVNNICEQKIVNDIKALKELCDVVVVSLHWGIESVFYPSPEQIELARIIIDKGASAVLGHGPRVNQGIEEYKHGLIAYSLGSFQFDFDHEIVLTEKLSESLILSMNMSKSGIEDYEIIPLKIDGDYVPRAMGAEERERFLVFISNISKPITDGKINKSWWFEQIGHTFITTNMYSWRTRITRYGLKHLLQCVKWLISPFILKCYAGIIRNNLKQAFGLPRP